MADGDESSLTKASHFDSEPVARDHAPKKPRVGAKVSMEADGGESEASINGHDAASMHVQETSKEHPRPFGGDDLTSACIQQKASHEASAVDGDPGNGDHQHQASEPLSVEGGLDNGGDRGPAHMQISSKQAHPVTGDLVRGHLLTSAHIEKVSMGASVGPAAEGTIHGDDLTSAHIKRASGEASVILVAEEAIDRHHHTSAHVRTPTEARVGPIMEDPINRHHPTSTRMRKAAKEANLGPHHFTSAVRMLSFFNQLLNGWPLNLDINRYEQMMLEDLLRRGHPDFREKIGTGIQAFQVRVNKRFDSRCFFVIRTDGSVEDFSYRKCVDKILPLPKNLKSKFSRDRTCKRLQK